MKMNNSPLKNIFDEKNSMSHFGHPSFQEMNRMQSMPPMPMNPLNPSEYHRMEPMYSGRLHPTLAQMNFESDMMREMQQVVNYLIFDIFI